MQRKKLISKTLTTAVMLALYIGVAQPSITSDRNILTKSPVLMTLMQLMASALLSVWNQLIPSLRVM